MNIATLLDLIADAAGDRIALGGAEGTTFGSLRERVRRQAGALAATKAELVAYLDVTGPDFVETLFAAAWAGIPFAPLNYRLRPSELGALLSRLGPSVLVHGKRAAEKAAAIAEQVSGLRLLEAGREGDPLAEFSFDADRVAVLLHTSGTTSEPKAAVLRHRQLFAYVVGSVDLAGAAASECALMCVPTYHIAGVASALSATYAGRRSVHLPDFDPLEWLHLAREESATHAFVVPTMLTRIVEALEVTPDLMPSELRVLSYGGAPSPPGLVERALHVFSEQTGFVNAFGLTETSSTVSVLGPEDHRAAYASSDPAVRARLRSAGRPLPGVEVRISDLGEVLLRGEQVSGEYLDRPGRVDPEGWFHSGDLGHIDAEGYLFLDGRGDDVIIRGGENISPIEVEEALLGHPDLREAAVVGVPDPEWGQRIAAAVVLREGTEANPDSLRAFVRERVASFKVPDRIAIVSELPYTPTGKLRRKEVGLLLAGEDTTV